MSVPTTIALRHRDTLLDSISKQHYHAVIVTKLGIALPTAQEETADPANADDTYVEATKRLRELTRDDKQLLLKKNIAGLAAGLTLLTSLALLVVWLSISTGKPFAAWIRLFRAIVRISVVVSFPGFTKRASTEGTS